MLKSIAIAAFALSVSGAAMAQSSGGSGSMGGGTWAAPDTSGGSPTSVAPPERSRTAPGSGARRGATTAKPALPPGPSAAEQTRRGAGQVDLNRNSATGSANPVTGSGSMERSGAMDRSGLPLGPGTGARDNRVPDSSVYNPGIQR